MQVQGPGNPRWASEWAAPDGTRIAGFGDSPNQADEDMARRAMRHMQGERATDAESMSYFHPEAIAGT
jgi:hypothetical protein